MMKRKGFNGKNKKVDLNAVPEPVDPRTPNARPPELAKAQASLQEKMPAGSSVASGFGFGDTQSLTDRTPEWRLFVFTNDVELKLPEKHAGFRVSRREVPAALSGPAWGKKAKD